MAKTLIGNIKGKNGRGIASIKKTGTTGSVDTYTITYTDSTTSTFTINNSDSIALQRQIVPSAAVESSATASQAYAAGDYVVVSGVLRKVKSAIAKGNTIGDSNSTATTVTGELATFWDSASQDTGWVALKNTPTWCVAYRKIYNIVYVLCSSSGAQEIGGSNVTLGETLPVGCRPSLPNHVSAIHGILSGAGVDLAAADFFVDSSGRMTLYTSMKATYWNAFAVFPVNK